MSCEKERFAFLLARTFQKWDVDAFLDEIGDWFERWFEAYQNSPWGPDRDDWRMQWFATISGVPGKVGLLEFPSSFRAVERRKELTADSDLEDQSEGQVLDLFRSVAKGG